MNDPSPFVAAIAGRGGGKTWAGAAKGLAFMMENLGTAGCVTAPTYKMLRMPEGTLETYLAAIPRELDPQYNKTEMELRLGTGNVVIFRSTEDPETLRGPNLAWFHMDEAAMSPLDAWGILVAALRKGERQQAWVTTTPKGYNWIYQTFGPSAKPGYSLHHWSARDNLHNPPDFVKRLEEDYETRKEYALQEIEGEFVIVSGMCFFAIDALTGMLEFCQNIVPVEEHGIVKVFKKPIVGRRYAAGVDLGEGNGGDYSVCIILDTQSLETVCTLRTNLLHQDVFALEFSKIYERYYKPFYVPESNVGALFIKKCIELGCLNLWYDDGEKRLRPGFRTTGSSSSHTSSKKMVVWGLLEEAIRDREMIVWDRDVVSEFFSFIREGDKLEAQEGAHDDCVDAMALALKAARERRPRIGKSSTSTMRPATSSY